jgi:hypothetical protein
VTCQDCGQPDEACRCHAGSDLLGFLSDFRSGAGAVARPALPVHPAGEPDGWVVDQEPAPVRDRADSLSASGANPDWAGEEHGGFEPPLSSPILPRLEAPMPPVVEAGPAAGYTNFPPPGPNSAPYTQFPPPAPNSPPYPEFSPPSGYSPPGPPPGGAPAPYGYPVQPYGWPLPPQRRMGPGRIIGIVAACLGGLIVLAIAIPLFLGTHASLHPAFTPAGYKPFSDRTERFSLAVPDSWQTVNPDSPGAAEAFQQLEQSNPAFQSMAGSGDPASEGMKFFAVGQQGSVNVIVKPLLGAGSSTLNDLQTQMPNVYQRMGATLLGSNIAQMNGRTFLQSTIELPVNQPNGSTAVVNETQDIFAANDFVYTVTLAGDNPDLATVGATFNVG